jgi:membrane protein
MNDSDNGSPLEEHRGPKPVRHERRPKSTGPVAFLIAVVKNWWQDDCFHWGAALAFHVLLSSAPLLFTLMFVAGLFVDGPAARSSIYDAVNRNFGPEAAAVVHNVTSTMTNEPANPWAALVAIVLAIFSASALFAQLQRTVNHIWAVEVSPSATWSQTILRRVLAVGMIVLFGAILVLSVAIAWLGAALGRFAGSMLPSTEWLVVGIDFGGSFLVISLATMCLFRWLPDARIGWGIALVGGMVTAFLFLVGKIAVSYYIRFADVGSAYGAAGSIIVFVVWVYYTAQAFFFGAEFTEVWAATRGAGIVPDDGARWERCDDSKAKERSADAGGS